MARTPPLGSSVGSGVPDLESIVRGVPGEAGVEGWPGVSAPPEVPAVDPDEVRRRLEAGAVLLDVREPNEWDTGHAPEATWIPMGDLDARLVELPTDRPIVVVCRSGGRSARVTSALIAAGYDATNLAGGMKAWAAAGFPVFTAGGARGAVA
jgi:rhodanese-related sulfurtransferase